MSEPPPTLQYFAPASGLSAAQFRAARALQNWAFFCWVGTPLGVLIGGFGLATLAFWVLDLHFSFHHRTERVAFIFLWLNSPSFLLWPFWGLLCWHYARRILANDAVGALRAARLCRWALAGGLLFLAAILYGFILALLHGRFREYPWWIFVILIIFTWAGFVFRMLRDLHAAAPAPPSLPPHRNDS